ncbi:MAG: PQQ-binding-like beta-propeller repeat protein, partial [Acidimicrobiia bacterium]
FGLLLGLVLVAGACDWSSVGFDASRSSYSAFDTKLTPANVVGLTQRWKANAGNQSSAPVVADGRLFVTNQYVENVHPGSLLAYDATGATCTGAAPATCTPVWSKGFPVQDGFSSDPQWSPPISSPLVTPDFVSAGGFFHGNVYVGGGYIHAGDYAGGSFDLATGAAVTGQLRTGAAPATAAQGAVYGYRTELYTYGSVLYRSYYDITRLFATVPSGQGKSFVIDGPDPNQLGSPREFVGSAPAVADHRLVVLSAGQLQTYDADGMQNCADPKSSGLQDRNTLPTTVWSCRPLWTATLGQPGAFDGMPAVAKGRVYVPELNGGVEVFDAAGCGQPTCNRLWTAHAGSVHVAPVAVTDTTLFVTSDDGHLYAFPSAGCGAATCEPIWTASIPGPHAPSVAGSVLFVGTNSGTLAAFDTHGCGQATCTPLWTTNVGAPISTAPAISDGRVFVTDTTGTIHAYGL